MATMPRSAVSVLIYLLWIAATFAGGQQGQNFYINHNGAGGGARFLQFASPSSAQHHQQHPTASQEFSNFFPPRTNGGPFSPFRGTAPPSYQVRDFDEESLPAASKYQHNFPSPAAAPQQQFIQQPSVYQLPPHSIVHQSSQQSHYDSSPASLLSPIASGFVAKHHHHLQTPQRDSSAFEDAAFQTSFQESERHIRPSSPPPQQASVPRYEFDEHGQPIVRPRNRFHEPIAFSEVTRIIQDNNPPPRPVATTTTTTTTESYGNALSPQQHSAAAISDEDLLQDQWSVSTQTEPNNYHRGRNSPYTVRGANKNTNNRLTVIADPTTTERSTVFSKNNNRLFYQKEQTVISSDTIPELSEDKYWNEQQQHEWLGSNESKSSNRLENTDEQHPLQQQQSTTNKPISRGNKLIRIKSNQPTTTSVVTTPSGASIYFNSQFYNQERSTRIKPVVTTASTSTSSTTVTTVGTTVADFSDEPPPNSTDDEDDVQTKLVISDKYKLERHQPAEDYNDEKPARQQQWWNNKSKEPFASSLVHYKDDHQKVKAPPSSQVNFDVVTMSHDHAFVAEDNFKGFVDSGVIDKTTEMPVRDELLLKNGGGGGTLLDEDLSSVVEMPADKHGNVVKKILPASAAANITPNYDDYEDSSSSVVKQAKKIETPRTTTQTIVNSEGRPPPSTSSTENWIVVSSVQTSRSISAARSISSPLPSKPQPPKSNNTGQNNNNSKTPKTISTVPAAVATTRKSNSVTTTTTPRHHHSSTENINDKLDQVQSDLSGAILDGGFPPAANKLAGGGVIPDIPSSSSSTIKQYKTMPSSKSTNPTTPITASSTTVSSTSTTTTTTTTASTTVVASDSSSITSDEDISEESADDHSSSFTRKFVPTTKRPKSSRKSLADSIQFEDVTNLLPPGYKSRGFTPKNAKFESNNTTTTSTTAAVVNTTTEKNSQRQSKSKLDTLSSGLKFKFDDVSAFLPPDYKAAISSPKKNDTSSEEEPEKEKQLQSEENNNNNKSFKDHNNNNNNKTKSFNRFQQRHKSNEEAKGTAPLDSIFNKIQFKETNELLPTDYQQNASSSSTSSPSSSTIETTSISNDNDSDSSNPENSSKVPDTKVVFPSRPGGNKKPPSKSSGNSKSSLPSHLIPHIQKGWPVRSTTEFHGWSTPSAIPISIDKILQIAKEAAAKDKESASSTSSDGVSSTADVTSTTSATTTTTTVEPTTPGICSEDCKLAGSIKLVDGVKWVPELLDHNTIEWQHLAREVESQLKNVYYTKEPLNHWCKGITIDAFSQGSVIVDYFVELNDLGHTVNTAEMKNIFNKALRELDASSNGYIVNSANRTQVKFGKFTLDPTYIDFFVLPKTLQPAIGLAEQNMWLPQWAIAVIVIGIASLLFVIIFGITILVNKHKNALKHPTALTEDMLNELNKNHMSGFDNYGIDDLYNMEDVCNEKPFKKRGSYYNNGSVPNIYDSWRSDWNGYYGNSHYNGSMHSGYSRRRSDYDTNF